MNRFLLVPVHRTGVYLVILNCTVTNSSDTKNPEYKICYIHVSTMPQVGAAQGV